MQSCNVAATADCSLVIDNARSDFVVIEEKLSLEHLDTSGHEKVHISIGELAEPKTRSPALHAALFQLHAHQGTLDKG
jgi:hypothetical protein